MTYQPMDESWSRDQRHAGRFGGQISGCGTALGHIGYDPECARQT
jgi:hypothetical protein